MAKTEVTKTPMSKTERMALIRVVRGRFKLLQDGLYVRAQEVTRAIEKQIERDHADVVANLKKRSDALTAKMNKLTQEMRDLQDEADSKGIKVRGVPERMWNPTFEPAQKANMIKEKLDEIGGLNGRWEFELKRQENDLVEQLILGDITSDGAQKFLELIPTPETLIPLPKGVKEISPIA